MTHMKRIGTKKEGESETMLRVSTKVCAGTKMVPLMETSFSRMVIFYDF